MQRDLAKLQRSAKDLARWQKAQQQLMGGRHAAALSGYEELLKHFPGVPQLWFETGIAAAGELDFDFAAQAFHKAADLAPTDASLLVLIGQQFHRLRRLDDARACFERAVAAAPNSPVAHVNLAMWLEREGRLDDAWATVVTGLAADPHDSQSRYFRAFLLHRKGLDTEAEAMLRDLIKSDPRDSNIRMSSRHLLGVVLDKLGQYDEALRQLLEAKALVRQSQNAAALERDYDKMDLRRRELLADLESDMIKRWRDEGPAVAHRPQLAFLGGHPRTGTTLIEQVLGAHPDLLAFDESEAFVQEIANQLAPPQSPKTLTAAELNSLSPPVRASMGQRYLKSLLRENAAKPAAKMLLDKNPSATASLHLWLRVFPDLKVIIPLRDPRDVVLSCFFQNLSLTVANVNFLSLERTARHYADLMDVWRRMRELGGFDWIETRYEDLVANLENEGRRVTKFLGFDWHPDQANYRDSARRKFVFAPTYSDVRKPVHNRAIGRWENYAGALKPIQAQLAPYCRAFGYG
jgi:Flp pilus assembly protein TadD